MTAGWCSRMVRAAMFAAVCVLLAALGHVLMSGSHVPWWALAAGAAATGGAGWALAGRERGLPLVVTVVVTAQTALHSAFSLAQPTAAGPEPGTHTSATPHDMSAMTTGTAHTHAMDAMDRGHGAAVGHAMDGSSSFGMLAAHLLAALLCGLWLAHGERAVFRLLRAVAARLAAPLRLPLAVPAAPHHPVPRPRRHGAAWSPRRLLLVHAITSRGPPPGTAV
ncbi:hypothetical protein ACWCPM_24225 [Streptomyces sp. NPDC002309]